MFLVGHNQPLPSPRERSVTGTLERSGLLERVRDECAYRTVRELFSVGVPPRVGVIDRLQKSSHAPRVREQISHAPMRFVRSRECFWGMSSIAARCELLGVLQTSAVERAFRTPASYIEPVQCAVKALS